MSRKDTGYLMDEAFRASTQLATFPFPASSAVVETDVEMEFPSAQTPELLP